MSTITAANSTFALAISNLFPVPQTLGGYAADDAFTTEAQETAEVVMGVDGRMSVGYIFNPVRQTVTIMPDSPSLSIFQAWQNAERTAREKYRCNGVIVMPAIGKRYTLNNGALMSAPPVPSVRKTLQAAAFIIVWESVIGEDI